VPREYDLIVIGAGTGGYVAAIRAAQLGLKTAVVEKQSALGGTCLLWGCIPTKALLEHAHALKVVRHARDWGVTLGDASAGSGQGPVGIDMGLVQARKDRIVAGLTKGVEFLFKKNKIDWIKGTARLTGNSGVDVFEGEKQTLRARKEIIVATGSAPRGIPGIEVAGKTGTAQAVKLGEDRAGVNRGPQAARDHAWFVAFDVTIVELLPRLVPVEDEGVSAELEKSFRKQGITSHTGASVTAAHVSGDGVDIDVQLGDGSTKRMRADYLLVATGRGPVTAGLNAEGVGLQMEKGYVKVDAQYRTNVPGISAIGDVITLGGPGHPQLAHVSSAEGILTAERIAGRESRPLNYDHVPGCTYCDPEIGSVGLTEAEAKSRGYDVRIGTFPFGVLGRAKMAGETEGFVKIVADRKYDELLGVHMIGPRSTELVAEATVALRLESTVEELIRTIHAHPTFAEAIGEAAHAVHGAAIHS